ncbi:zinc finger domain-containing protein [Streptomyces phytophilus]|uniref:zinc finger domain-containing protein n=1 Tax=Streptomyces phytophilus TaxID=722715 RepID=UPI0015EFFC14|nr:hypothetical protein [Streptomyces phytophilus]
MTPDDAKQLLAACAAFDNRQPSAIAARAWAHALPDITLDNDAIAAVARYYGTPPAKPGDRLWIQPHDVRTLRAQIRAERLANFTYEPPPGDADPRYLERLRGQLDATASGTTAAPTTAPALEGGPHPDVAEQLEHVGRTVPDRDDPDTPPIKRPGPLGIACPKCAAPTGRPCRLPSGTERRPHPARARVARGEPAALEDPNEIARRRAVSERRAALEGADQ